MYLQKEVEQYLYSEFEPLVGEVSISRLFIGYGIFKDDFMFALYLGKKIYLRAQDGLVDVLRSQGAARFQDLTPQMDPNLVLYHYYQIPLDFIHNKEVFKRACQISIQQLEENHLAEQLLKRKRIKELFNFTIKHERLLAKIGIYTIDEFRKVGAFNAFIRLKKLGVQVTPALLLMFYAALKNVKVRDLGEDTKRQCLEKLCILLGKNGFRRFNPERYLQKTF